MCSDDSSCSYLVENTMKVHKITCNKTTSGPCLYSIIFLRVQEGLQKHTVAQTISYWETFYQNLHPPNAKLQSKRKQNLIRKHVDF